MTWSASSFVLLCSALSVDVNIQIEPPLALVKTERTVSRPSDVVFCNSAYNALQDAEAVVIATEWEQFRALDLARLKSVMARPVIIDHLPQ